MSAAATIEPCIICGRSVQINRPHLMAHVTDGSADLGWFPIGRDCADHPDPGRGLTVLAIERWGAAQ